MIVYMATCLETNKSYIGVTKCDIRRRKYMHFRSSKNGSKYSFHSAIRKHGKDSFKWDILFNAETIDEMYAVERYLIRYYGTLIPFGYNMIDGGATPPPMFGSDNPMFGVNHSEESKEKIRERMIGLSWSERFGEDKSLELREKLIERQTGSKHSGCTIEKMKNNSYWKNNGHLVKGENNPNYGHRWSDEMKNKIRGENNGMYGIRRFGSENGMYGKHHSDDMKKDMSNRVSYSGNPRYRKLDNLIDIIDFYKNCGSINKTAKHFGDNYNKIKRELIHNGIITV